MTMRAKYVTTDKLESDDMIVWRQDELYTFVKYSNINYETGYGEVHVRDDRYEFMLTTAQPWDAWTVVREVTVGAD